MEKITYPVNFDPVEYRQLQEIAREQDRSVAYLVRRALREFLPALPRKGGKIKPKCLDNDAA